MICISRRLLRTLGADVKLISDLLDTDGGGLATSDLFSFGGGGNGGRDTRALESEPEPRRLILVGMGDRYGAGSKLATVVELCVTDGSDRAPTDAERADIVEHLIACSNPNAQRIAALFRG